LTLEYLESYGGATMPAISVESDDLRSVVSTLELFIQLQERGVDLANRTLVVGPGEMRALDSIRETMRESGLWREQQVTILWLPEQRGDTPTLSDFEDEELAEFRQLTDTVASARLFVRKRRPGYVAWIKTEDDHIERLG
jgi:hypothetical protein